LPLGKNKCVEIAAAAARASLNVRPGSSQLEESDPTVFWQNHKDKNIAACDPAPTLLMMREPAKFPP
jgi:hypothetical protein